MFLVLEAHAKLPFPALRVSTAYFFRVRAVNAQGNSTPSSEMEATAYDGLTPTPGAPTNLVATSWGPSGHTELGGSQCGGISDHSLRIPIQHDKWYFRWYMGQHFWIHGNYRLQSDGGHHLLFSGASRECTGGRDTFLRN